VMFAQKSVTKVTLLNANGLVGNPASAGAT